MTAYTPTQVHEQFTEAFFEHDIDALLALYDADAVMAPGPGREPVRRRVAIREALTELLALKPHDGTLTTVFCIEKDDLALMRSKWRFAGTGTDGQPVRMSGSGMEVMHRLPDDGWVHLLDNPWGASD